MSMQISIVVPFEGSQRETPLWAHEEERIDFRREPDRAARCTVSFAAMELRDFLLRTLRDARIVFVRERPDSGRFIELSVPRPERVDCGFRLEPEGQGVLIVGEGRPGVLYGAYHLLRLQGWEWFAPGPGGEQVPPTADDLRLPAAAVRQEPSMSLGRGFDFVWLSKESHTFWIWMARSGLNVSSWRAATGPLGRKLGMIFRMGGHVFEKILDPDRPMPSGRTLWEEHRDWYGLPAEGERTKEKAQSTQFCVSRPDLLSFLGAELLEHVAGPWKEADRVDVWGFDTWGSGCGCPGCRGLGTGTDRMLVLLAAMRRALDAARRDGRLDHDVRLIGCAYEGTATMEGPTRPVPAELLAAGDTVTSYPINRCYGHDFEDPGCAVNVFYRKALDGWLSMDPTLPHTLGEYYNVSKFEDLPLLFTARMRRDIPAFHAHGVRGLTYMHVPMTAWGVRTLTQWLYARLAWDAGADVDALLDRYFTGWYGPHAGAMRRAYGLVERAGAAIGDWRRWGKRSVLSQLLAWDGSRPTAAIPADTHWAGPAEAVASGRRSVKDLEEALAILDGERRKERNLAAGAPEPKADGTVDPAQARAAAVRAARFEMRLGDDRRGLLYGLDTMRLMTAVLAYHDALRRGAGGEAEAAWAASEEAADRLDASWIPMGWEYPGAGSECQDGLTRTQLREVLRRCRRHRA